MSKQKKQQRSRDNSDTISSVRKISTNNDIMREFLSVNNHAVFKYSNKHIHNKVTAMDAYLAVLEFLSDAGKYQCKHTYGETSEYVRANDENPTLIRTCVRCNAVLFNNNGNKCQND